jgi:acetyltransferase-like isoleucine patch superfamily enzyme
MTKRHVSLPESAEAGVEEFITTVDERLASEEDTCEVVADVLVDLFGDRDAYERFQASESGSPGQRVRLQSYDPCNVTLESEYYAEKDEDAFERSKHLQWLWRQFDATPLADNVEFALAFRQMLANHLFAEAGDDLRLFKGITFTYGHNIELGDNVVVHDDVHLDDRGELVVGDRVSLSDDVHVYSHDHDIVDQTEVTNYRTIVEDDVRVTHDAMIRAGCRIGENALIGAKSTVQTDIPAHHVAVGSPARSVRVKPGWEDVAAHLSASEETERDQRVLDSRVPEDVERFDEFGRDLQVPHDD